MYRRQGAIPWDPFTRDRSEALRIEEESVPLSLRTTHKRFGSAPSLLFFSFNGHLAPNYTQNSPAEAPLSYYLCGWGAPSSLPILSLGS